LWRCPFSLRRGYYDLNDCPIAIGNYEVKLVKTLEFSKLAGSQIGLGLNLAHSRYRFWLDYLSSDLQRMDQFS
jgi:hypothetical protein